MSSKLEQLRAMTVVVADTGDIEQIKQWSPIDATTNPSLIYKAAQMPQFKGLVEDAISYSKDQPHDSRLEDCLDRLTVNFGREIAAVVPGRVSLEVDARLSFNRDQTIRRARKLITMCHELGISREKVLIKIAATWEGIKAAEELETEGINCNLTLLFSFAQAIACAEAGVFLISPFVGRILDWYQRETGKGYTPVDDPGVLSVSKIYEYYKTFGYQTIVMGASFRSVGEIEQLAGCDRLTIGPQFLHELDQDQGELKQVLFKDHSNEALEQLSLDEKAFRWMLNEDAMATEKLSEGIRLFSADLIKLEALVNSFS